MDLHGTESRRIVRCRKSIHMSPDVYDDISTLYSKLRHRLRARHVTSNPTLQSPHQTIYFSTPYYEVDKQNPIRTVHSEVTFIEVLVGMRLDFSSNTLTVLLLHSE